MAKMSEEEVLSLAQGFTIAVTDYGKLLGGVMSDDPADVQISFKIRLPKGARVTKEALNEVYLKWVETGKLPKFMEISGIFWRNPARYGKLTAWRYSEGSEKAKDKPRGGIESSPRGSHEDARVTLQGLLQALRPFS